MENNDIEKNGGIVKEEVSVIIRETQKVINNFDSRIKLKKSELADVKNIKKVLKNIENQLDSIKNVTENITSLYEELVYFLEQQQDELKNCNSTLIKGNKKQLIELINENLPDDMNLRKLVDIESKWKIVLESNISEQNINSRKKQKKIYFYKEENPIGEMVLEETEGDLLIRIKMHDELNYQDFKIDNALKVFPIVSHIITRYNYKEEVARNGVSHLTY